MMKCGKCGKEVDKSMLIAWKCTSCGKAYKSNLDKVMQLAEKKRVVGSVALLKCKNCGSNLDNGNEHIYWKCKHIFDFFSFFCFYIFPFGDSCQNAMNKNKEIGYQKQ